MRIIFIGPPGAGKGTQSQRLSAHLHIPHLSTGAMLRQALEEGSSMGRLGERYMAAGKLVPDPIILQMVGQRLTKPDCADGVLFDGFPRTIPQAEALDKFWNERGTPLDIVLELRVSDELVIQRLAGRGREDDQPDVIAERLRSYWRQTRPLLEYYEKRGLCRTIDGAGSTDEVFERILQALPDAGRSSEEGRNAS